MKITLKLLAFALISVFVISLAGCGGKPATDQETLDEVTSGAELIHGTVNAVITVEGYGDIKLELDANTAPITVTNFVKLANSGFYEGITFHRSVPDFMIQGGDPDGNGQGGSKDQIKGEFSQNGVKNDISHKRGVISMARRSNDMNSASSQFFIVQKDSEFLDGAYAAFGKVTEGMDIVDKMIADSPVIDQKSGLVDPNHRARISKVTIID